MKKGRHRRFEEARSLKRSVATAGGRCPECGAEPEDVHASWCLAEEDEYEQILGPLAAASVDDGDERDPLDDRDPLDQALIEEDEEPLVQE